MANAFEDVRSPTTMEPSPAPNHEDHEPSEQHATVDRIQPDTNTTEEQLREAEKDDPLVTDWGSLTWWQKPTQAARFVVWYTLCLGLLVFGMLIFQLSDDDKKKSQRKQTQQTLLPNAASSTTSSQPASIPDPSLSSPSELTNDPTKSDSTVLHRSFAGILWFAPHIVYALCGYAMVKVGGPPQQNQQLCVARRTETGFQGNSDIYGLGIRLGFYIQWLCLAFMFNFLPSARLYVVSGYLLYQLGMIVALIMLLSASTCTFTAEVTITLQLLWAGSAIALVPSVSKKTKYPAKSDYLGIDLASAILAVVVFIFTSWFYVRFYFLGQYDFTPTCSDGTWTFFLGPVKPGDTKPPANLQIIWVLFAAYDLVGMLQDHPRELMFSSFLVGNWWFSATMATGSLVLLVDWAFRGVRLLFAANQVLAKGFVDEDEDKEEEDGRAARVNKSVSQFVMDITRVWLVLLLPFSAPLPR